MYVTLNTRAERTKLINKNTQSVDSQIIETKNNACQLELKNRFAAQEKLDDINALNKNTAEMIQTKCSITSQETEKGVNIIAYKSSNEEASRNDREHDPHRSHSTSLLGAYPRQDVAAQMS